MLRQISVAAYRRQWRLPGRKDRPRQGRVHRDFLNGVNLTPQRIAPVLHSAQRSRRLPSLNPGFEGTPDVVTTVGVTSGRDPGLPEGVRSPGLPGSAACRES